MGILFNLNRWQRKCFLTMSIGFLIINCGQSLGSTSLDKPKSSSTKILDTPATSLINSNGISYKSYNNESKIKFLETALHLKIKTNSNKKLFEIMALNKLPFDISLVSFKMVAELKTGKRILSDISLGPIAKEKHHNLNLNASPNSDLSKVFKIEIKNLILLDKEGIRVDSTPTTLVHLLR